ncbi:MAG: DUF1302 domain-containing protein [bacterium]
MMKKLINKNTASNRSGETIMNRKMMRLSSLALAVAMGLTGLVSLDAAKAMQINKGDFQGSWDTTVTYGGAWRMEKRDSSLVGKANLNPFIFLETNQQQRQAPGRWSVNSDDGNLLYDRGDTINHSLKVLTEFGFSYKNMGGLIRANALYDFENAGRDDISDVAKSLIARDANLLDAFVYYDFDVAENHAASIRLGRQVVSWGESAIIQGGINVINPVDVSKLRVAGAELKEALLPMDMVWGTVDLTDNLSMEALYMLEFEQIDPDPQGTYFSTNDFGTPGADFVMLGFGLFDEQFPGATIRRGKNRPVSENGQYGVAFRYYSQELNDTEFGLYYLNYHSRLPLLSGVAVTNSSPESGSYFVEYPEDIHLIGLSFNTTIGTVAFAGEHTYRPNQPLQFDDVELLFAALSPLNAAIPSEYDRFNSQLGDFAPGDEVRGWERHRTSQFQFTLTNVFGPNDFLGVDQWVAFGEFGAYKVWDMPSKDVLRYNGPGTDTAGGADLNSGRSRNPITQEGGFADSFSWGYRLAMRFDYNSVFGTAINLQPRIAFNHDVTGTSPGPGGSFIEGRKSMTVGVNGIYLEKWTAGLSYTSFFGAGDFNLIHDRDFLSANIKYSF